MRTMNLQFKTCSSKKKLLLRPCNSNADRLTSLPDELLCRILCMLSTKDAAATLILSKRMTKAFSWISSFDLDDSPISHCSVVPYLVERFPLFESFVDNLLTKFSPHNTHHLARLRLHFGGNLHTNYRHKHPGRYDRACQPACFPDVLPARLNLWISCPLAHGALRELDLSFRVRRPHECMLPPSLFACLSLQVLRLDTNLAFDDAKIPLICLPSLKILHITCPVFNDDDFVGRLVSNCPGLEDLSLSQCFWMNGDRLSISSPSLRRLFLQFFKVDDSKRTDLLLLDTPNLQYLYYSDDAIAHGYSIAHMNALVEAFVVAVDPNSCFETELSLLRVLSHVQKLSLIGSFCENLYFAGGLKDQLPVFRNLRTLELDGFDHEGRWDIVLLLMLHHSPSLETLIFPRGPFGSISVAIADANSHHVDEPALEAEGWRTAHAIPSCCFTHLKRVVFERCFGTDRELYLIKFLLANSSILEEFVLCLSTPRGGRNYSPPNLDQFENTVKDLPRASSSCLITLQR